MQLCKKCRAIIPIGERVCKQCGTAISDSPAVAQLTMISCKNCGAQVSPNSKFCGKCGNTIHKQPKNVARTLPVKPTSTQPVGGSNADSVGFRPLKCEMCSGNRFVKENGYYTCQSCGTSYSLEEAKKLMISVSGAVRIDRTSEIKNLHQLAIRARQTNNPNDGYRYYSQIVAIEPKNWEAYFYSVYYYAVLSYQQNPGNAAQSVVNSLHTALDLLKRSSTNANDISARLNQMSTDLFGLANGCGANIFNEINEGRRLLKYDPNPGRGLSVWSNECVRLLPIVNSIYDILYVYGDNIITVLGNNYYLFALEAWKKNVLSHVETVSLLLKSEQQISKARLYVQKIREYDPNFKIPKEFKHLIK